MTFVSFSRSEAERSRGFAGLTYWSTNISPTFPSCCLSGGPILLSHDADFHALPHSLGKQNSPREEGRRRKRLRIGGWRALHVERKRTMIRNVNPLKDCGSPSGLTFIQRRHLSSSPKMMFFLHPLFLLPLTRRNEFLQVPYLWAERKNYSANWKQAQGNGIYTPIRRWCRFTSNSSCSSSSCDDVDNKRRDETTVSCSTFGPKWGQSE